MEAEPLCAVGSNAKANEARPLKALEVENAKLKKLPVEVVIEGATLEEMLENTLRGPE